MSERKVLNKYYPPDFDPSKIPRLRLPKDRQYTVRLMAPCNMRCKTCGEYIYKGKKFNARKETVQNEEYLGIKIFRFYIKCPRCLAEITFKTDPQNADYIVEHGATRNFQALKLAEEQAEREAKEQEEEEKNNPMKLLENRTKASKQEMELLEALEELKDLNQRHAKVDFDHLLNQNHLQLVEKKKQQEDEDEALIRSVFAKTDGGTIKRIIDESDSENEETSIPKFKIKKEDPTDILCENNIKSPNKAVKKEVWEKSIGSLGSANKISGFIKIKRNINSDDAKCSTSHATNLGNAKTPDTQQNNMPSVLSGGLGLLGTYSDSDQSSASD